MNEAQKPAVLKIEGEMNIFRASELKQTLLAALDGAATLEIDLSAVTELDTAGVQLLMLAKRQAQAGRQELRLTAHSPAVLEVLERFNLAGYFGDQIVIAPEAAPFADHAVFHASRGANES